MQGDPPGLGRARPFRPLGLHGWTDEWPALGMRVPDDRTSYVLVWRAGGDPELRLPVGRLTGRDARVEILNPSSAASSVVGTGDGLRVSLPRTPAVVLVRLVV
ncbi:hypothetical protein [Streptomyces sp. NPDC055013]